jgi:photosystem II stability/assembly factor-like uncharacterized protein
MKRRKRLRLAARALALAAALALSFAWGSAAPAQELEDFSNLGLYGGQVYDLAIDPSMPGKIFAGTYLGGGLFQSGDGGGIWNPVLTGGEVDLGEDAFRNHAVYDVEIAPGSPQTIYVANQFWIEKSADGGETWSHILNSAMQRDCGGCGGEGDDFRYVLSLAVDPTDSNTLYAGTGGPMNTYAFGAVYKTTDGGATWTKLNGGADLDFAVADIDIDPQNPGVIWAVTNSFGFGGFGGTLYRSGDAGATWQPIFSLTPFGGAYFTVEVKPDDSNTVFTGSGFGVIRHFFNGSIWNLAQPIPESALVEDIVFDPQDPDVIYATWLSPPEFPFLGDGIGKVARSADGGFTWEVYPHEYDFISLAAHPAQGNVLYAGDRNLGIFRSQDFGQTWSPVNEGVEAVIVYDVAVDPDDSSHLLAGTISGVYERQGAGSWVRLLEGLTRSLLFHPSDSLTIYAGQEGFLGKTLDGGNSWSFSNLLGPDGNNYVSDIALDPSDPSTLFISITGYSGYGEILRSIDGGVFFATVLNGMNSGGEPYAFNTVEVDPSNGQHVLAGGGNFFAPEVLGDLWESTDGGTTWSRVLNDVIINDLLINPDNPEIMYAGAGYSGGTEVPVYRSTDGGTTWEASSDGMPEDSAFNAVTDLDFSSGSADVVYAGTNHQGVYVSTRAEGWLNLGTPPYDVFAIAISSLYSATQGGLLQLTGTGVIAGKVTDSLTQEVVDGATVFTDTGGRSVTVNGEYIMVVPSAVCSVTAAADGHANMTVENVTVLGGEVSWVDMSMESGLPDTSAGPQTEIRALKGNDYCFVATAAYGSLLSRHVQTLRKFRDAYLMPYAAGRRLVDFYYRVGKPASIYMENHPWLKPPVRAALYPLVGFAWLMVSTSTPGKVLMVLFILIMLTAVVGMSKMMRRDDER